MIREHEARRKPIDAAIESNTDSVSNNFKVEKTDSSNISPILVQASSVHTICNYEGIKVQVCFFINNEKYLV